MENKLAGLNNQEKAAKNVKQLEGRSIEIIQSEEQASKQVKKVNNVKQYQTE